jgi:hypothetical protein
MPYGEGCIGIAIPLEVGSLLFFDDSPLITITSHPIAISACAALADDRQIACEIFIPIS